MSFEVSVLDKPCDDILFKSWNGTRIESKAFIKDGYKFFGKNHISDSQRGGDCFGEGIQIDYVIIL